jgi:hypothetical protein
MAINTIPSFRAIKVQEFTSGTTNWTAPSGVYFVECTLVGGGGGGGGVFTNSSTRGNAGGGGGGGGVVKKVINVTPGTTYSIVIGAGGAGGFSSGATSANGGAKGTNSTFNTTTIAYGGEGGSGVINGTPYYTYTNICATGGGEYKDQASVTDPLGAGGGGGANKSVDAYQNSGTDRYFIGYSPVVQGQNGRAAGIVNDKNQIMYTTGGQGIDGFGGGGGGGFAHTTSFQWLTGSSVDGAGAGGKVVANNTSANGTAATVNTGGGGGGSAAMKPTTGSFDKNGGNGGSGYCRLVWWQ